MKITSHVWFPTSERLAMIYKFVCLFFLIHFLNLNFIIRLFVLPYYESAIVEQNLLLNKRQKDVTEMKGKKNKSLFYTNLFLSFKIKSNRI